MFSIMLHACPSEGSLRGRQAGLPLDEGLLPIGQLLHMSEDLLSSTITDIVTVAGRGEGICPSRSDGQHHIIKQAQE
jgi:hypothetical protein